MLRLFVSLFFVCTLSLLTSMEIPDSVYSSVRCWAHCSKKEIIKESLYGLSLTRERVPISLWNKAKKAAQETVPDGGNLFEPDYVQRVFDMIPEVIDGIDELISSGRNIACVRVFTLLKSGGYSIHNIPYIFCSGTSVSPKISEDIRWLIRNIASYDFVSSSDQAFAHSERAFALFLLKEAFPLCDFRHLYNDIRGWVVQVHNLSQEMCSTCKSFFKNESPYFIDVNKTGYFVGKEYLNAYKEAFAKWDYFIKLNAGRIKVEDLYHWYLSCEKCEDNSEKRSDFLKIVQPYNFNDIIRSSAENPIVLFSYVSSEYEECLVFKFDY